MIHRPRRWDLKSWGSLPLNHYPGYLKSPIQFLRPVSNDGTRMPTNSEVSKVKTPMTECKELSDQRYFKCNGKGHIGFICPNTVLYCDQKAEQQIKSQVMMIHYS